MSDAHIISVFIVCASRLSSVVTVDAVKRERHTQRERDSDSARERETLSENNVHNGMSYSSRTFMFFIAMKNERECERARDTARGETEIER